jgi:hypothetical protein
MFHRQTALYRTLPPGPISLWEETIPVKKQHAVRKIDKQAKREGIFVDITP